MKASAPITAVVLAAGASTRLGRPKQTVEMGGETLVARAVRVAQEAGFAPVSVVVADAGLIDGLQALGATVLLNRQSSEGMASSIRTGVAWAQEVRASGVVLVTCDQVAVTPGHLRALASDPAVVTGSYYAGRTGVPAYFPVSSFEALLALQGDTGARELLRGVRAVAEERLALDVDTEADVGRALVFLKTGAVE